MLIILLKGLLIGLVISVPVGPIGILCIQRSLYNGFRIGLMTGLGAATADGLFSLIAGFGVTAVTSFLDRRQFYVKLLGGLFLIYMAFVLWRSPPSKEKIEDKTERSAWHAYGTSCLLTLTNPMTLIGFMAIFASIGIDHESSLSEIVVLVLSIIVGSALWWLTLSAGVAFFLHHRVSPNTAHYINTASGSVMAFFGLLSLISAFYPRVF